MGLLIINPNPVFDRTILLDSLVPGAVMRTLQVEVTAGGKGINVARVLRALGRPAPLLIPVGGHDRDRYRRLLSAEGAEATVIDVPGSVRVASIYLERANPRVTVVNDAGDPCDERTWDAVVAQAASAVGPRDIVLVMGSLPPGLPAHALVPLVQQCHDAGARVLIDTAPTWLASALEANPDVVTPNLDEALAVLGGTAAHTMDASEPDAGAVAERACSAARELRTRGAVRAIVTAGAHGVAMAGDEGTTWTPAIRVQAVSTVGAGDSFVAGFADVWQRSPAQEPDWQSAVRYGIATSAASCEQVRAGGIDPQRVATLFSAMSTGPTGPTGSTGPTGQPAEAHPVPIGSAR